jgi:hypothetical protein
VDRKQINRKSYGGSVARHVPCLQQIEKAQVLRLCSVPRLNLAAAGV